MDSPLWLPACCGPARMRSYFHRHFKQRREAWLSRVVHHLACNAVATSFEQCLCHQLRLRIVIDCKPLIPVDRVPLVERNVRALIQDVRHDVVLFARCNVKRLLVPVPWV